MAEARRAYAWFARGGGTLPSTAPLHPPPNRPQLKHKGVRLEDGDEETDNPTQSLMGALRVEVRAWQGWGAGARLGERQLRLHAS